jgi:hypothetical protein
MLLMHAVDLYWLVMPVLHPEGVHVVCRTSRISSPWAGFSSARSFWLMLAAPLVP